MKKLILMIIKILIKKIKNPKKKNKKTWKPHDPREHLNLVLIGHVDAGKSTISGQILLSTGQIDERTIQKYRQEAKQYKKESWWIAYIMDEDDEEKAKGKTVECGRAHFDTKRKRYTILDAPGHKSYVPNMISGASQADVGILVVSARTGEFEAGFERGGQTREHSMLAWTLGISRIVIVINKMDSCTWSEKRYTEIKTEVNKHLLEIGFKEKYLEFLPISGQEGTNIKDPLDPKICKWFKGKSLLDTLDGLKKLKRDKKKPLRIPVLDRYKGENGLTAIGKVEAGTISVGEKVSIMPSGSYGTISNLVIDDVPVKNASTGENVLVSFETNKSNVSDDTLYGGCIISSFESPSPICIGFTAEIYLAELPNNTILTVGYTSMFHCHNVAVECEVVELLHRVHKKTRKRSKKQPPFLRAKDSGVLRFAIRGNYVSVEPYSDCASLGRFALRDQGKTVAIGRIETVETKN